MSGKSKKSSAKIDRPFARKILAEARKRAEEYQVINSRQEGHWYGRGLELPHVFGDGATPAACIDQTRDALAAAVAYLLEQNEKPPTPAREGRRTHQVNVRLTAEDRAILETTACRKGFQGRSDFVRAAALEESSR